MESNFNNKDFEQFVKQNADQYRMFPSEKVWKGIHNTLHIRKRWYGIGFIFLLLTIGTVTWVMISSSGKEQHVPINHTAPANNSLADQNNQNKEIASTSLNKTFFIPGINSWQKHPAPPIIILNSKSNLENRLNSILDNESETINEIANDDSRDFESIKNNETIAAEIKAGEIKDIYPLSIESVVNSFTNSAVRKKISWQIYFAPTVSYRKLAENKAFLSSPQSNNTPYSYAAIYDVNSAVTHKPDMGFELGFNAGYLLSPHLKIIGGLQFNVSKYDIRAYTYYPTELATIALRTDNGIRSSVSTPTNYRNFDGYKPNWLHNLYLSASAPFGAELKLKGNDKNYLGIGGTIQPTYILGDRAYMISTDYKNYAEVPQLIRRWNVSTSFETFAGYTTGRLNWKIGPQVRYQLLSSFQKRYPVKEHIFDFGLKVGVMLNQ